MVDQALLSEHEAAPAESTKSDGYTPTPEERKDIELVNRFFEKAKKFRKRFDENWLDNYRYFRGKQWKEARPSYRHSEVINFIFQTIQSQVPILADARQRIEYVAREPSDTEFAKILDQVAESDWEDGNWTYKLAEMLFDGHIYGTGLGGLDYNAQARFGEGTIEFKSSDPFYCFPDPNAKDVNEGSRFFIYAEPVDLDTIKREYPEKGKFVKPDLIDLLGGNKQQSENERFKSPVDNKTVVDQTSNGDDGDGNQALKITCYVYSDEVTEEQQPEIDEQGQPVLDPATNQPKVSYVQKLKYPNGRKICIAGGVKLSESPMPLEDGIFPFVRFVNYIDPRSFWGISEIEQLKGPQNIFNKVYSFVLDVLTLTGNPIWIVDDTAEVDTDNLFNRPGDVIEKAAGSEVRREAGVQLQPYVLQILDRVREYIDSISGSNDVTRGVRPEGITAASAISQLQEAAQTRIRQKSRNLDATIQNFGKIYKSFALERYDAPRVFRMTNQEGANQYFKFHVEKMEDGTKVAHVRNYAQDEQGNFKESIDSRQFEIRGDFDVRVSTGSSLPFAKDAKFAKARQMFQDGVIDDQEYLKQADYPNWEAVLQRVEQKKQQQMQAEMAAKQSGPPPGAGAPPPQG